MKRLLLFLVLVPSMAWAQYTETFYLCNGGDGSLPEFYECATAYDEADFNNVANWAAIVSDDGLIGPGDAVVFMDAGGAFDTELDVQGSGLAGSPITLVANVGDTPIINSTANGIHLTADDYITIDGITVTEFTGRGIYATNSDSVVIQNCDISGGDGVAPDHGIQIQGTDNTLETGIQIIDNTIGAVGVAEDDSVTFNGVIVQETDGAVIARNDVSTTNSVGIRHILGAATDSTNGQIYQNDVNGCYGGIVVNNSDTTDIYRNTIRDGKGIGIGVAYDSDGAEIYYNLIYNLEEATTNLWNGIDINHDSQAGVVYNNTVYQVFNNSLAIDDETLACDDWVFSNNIFDARENTGTGLALRIGAALTYTSDYNALVTKTTASNIAPAVSFETFTGTADDATTDNWASWTESGGGAPGAIDAVTVADPGLSSVPDGTYALKMVQAGGGVQTILASVRLSESTSYTIDFSGMSDGAATMRCALYRGGTYLQDDGSWAAVANWDVADWDIGVGDTSWTTFSHAFTSDAFTGNYSFRCENLFNNGDIYVDNVRAFATNAVIADYNGPQYVYADYLTNSSQDANSLNVAPSFIDTSADNFLLQAGSLMINAGTGVGLGGERDYAGNKVPSYDRAVDIGAYEAQYARRWINRRRRRR